MFGSCQSKLLIFSIFVQIFQFLDCSIGDSYPSYRSCVKKCRTENCDTDDQSSYASKANQKWIIKLLWSCPDNCHYECMWPMVRICQHKRWKIPQFGGKWPFTRWLGIQEPASAVFSLFNLISTACMFRQFCKTIRHPSPMYWIWNVYAGVSFNTWLWSILFHIRDIPFTERMDYIGAASIIFYTLYAFGFRILVFRGLIVKLLFTLACLFFFVQHILHLIMKPFDYRYNFDSLLFLGVSAGLGTLLWCLWNWRLPHVKYAAMYVTLTMFVALLEIFDFSPLLWTFDAHSLWHLATTPLPYFIFRFAIEDCRFLRRMGQTAVSAVY